MSQNNEDKINGYIPTSFSCPAGISTSLNEVNYNDYTWGHGSVAEQSFVWGITNTSTMDPIHANTHYHDESYPKSAQHDWNTSSINASNSGYEDYKLEKANIDLNETLFSKTDHEKLYESKSSTSDYFESNSSYELGKSNYDYGYKDSFDWGIGGGNDKSQAYSSSSTLDGNN